METLPRGSTVGSFVERLGAFPASVAVLVYFDAPWCPACRNMPEEIHKNVFARRFPSGRAMGLRVDIEKCPDLASELNVVAVPSFQIYRQAVKLTPEPIVGTHYAKLSAALESVLGDTPPPPSTSSSRSLQPVHVTSSVVAASADDDDGLYTDDEDEDDLEAALALSTQLSGAVSRPDPAPPSDDWGVLRDPQRPAATTTTTSTKPKHDPLNDGLYSDDEDDEGEDVALSLGELGDFRSMDETPSTVVTESDDDESNYLVGEEAVDHLVENGEINSKWMRVMVGPMGYKKIRAATALYRTGNAGINKAVVWLAQHEDIPKNLELRISKTGTAAPAPVPATATTSAPPAPEPTLPPSVPATTPVQRPPTEDVASHQQSSASLRQKAAALQRAREEQDRRDEIEREKKRRSEGRNRTAHQDELERRQRFIRQKERNDERRRNAEARKRTQIRQIERKIESARRKGDLNLVKTLERKHSRLMGLAVSPARTTASLPTTSSTSTVTDNTTATTTTTTTATPVATAAPSGPTSRIRVRGLTGSRQETHTLPQSTTVQELFAWVRSTFGIAEEVKFALHGRGMDALTEEADSEKSMGDTIGRSGALHCVPLVD